MENKFVCAKLLQIVFSGNIFLGLLAAREGVPGGTNAHKKGSPVKTEDVVLCENKI